MDRLSLEETKVIITKIPDQPAELKEEFFPKGAIAFFILLVILLLGFWYSIYFLMIERV